MGRVFIGIVAVVTLYGIYLNITGFDSSKANEVLVSQNQAEEARAQADQAQANAMEAQAKAQEMDAVADIAEVGDDMLAVFFLGTSNVLFAIGFIALSLFLVWRMVVKQ